MAAASRPPLHLQYWDIDHLPGVSAAYRQQLRDCGIHNTRQLLSATATPQKQQALAGQLQLHWHHVAKWSALANLARIPSVGDRYCGLLLHAGITSVEQLAQLPPQQVYRQVLRLNVATFQRKDLCPSLEDVLLWAQQAKLIESAIQARSLNRGTKTSP